MPIPHKDLFEYVGIAAVVAGLVFVAFELRQANQIAEVDSVADVYEKFQGINEILMTDTKLAELVAGRFESWDELDPVDQLKLQSWNYHLMNTYITANIAYENGLLDETAYLGMLDNIAHDIRISSGAIRENWRYLLDNHPHLAELNVIQFLDGELGKYQ